MENPDKIRIGISSCLLGEKVRWNGDGKEDRYLTRTLAEYFDYVPVCPEFEVGMGVPRETVRLEGKLDKPRMVASKSGKDWTREMNRFSRQRTKELEKTGLHGFIFKKGSPSCGMERVPVYTAKGQPQKQGMGIFARTFTERFPLLPVEEEGRLHDPRLRDNFIERVFAFKRLTDLYRGKFTMGGLVEFHSRHKYQILAHSPKHYQEMGRLVAEGKNWPPKALREEYSRQFMEALRIAATPRKHTNVLMHILGFLKKPCTPFEKGALLKTVKDYHAGLVPLVVPVTLIAHYIQKAEAEYILKQTYLEPHPKELMLRNHV